jgi:hypothetical protein
LGCVPDIRHFSNYDESYFRQCGDLEISDALFFRTAFKTPIRDHFQFHMYAVSIFRRRLRCGDGWRPRQYKLQAPAWIRRSG